MRQRNDTGYPQHVSAWPTDKDPDRAPRDVAPGGEIDFPELLGGFTSLEPEPDGEEAPAAAGEAGPEDAQDAPPTPKPKPRAKTTAPTASEGGEAA